MIDMEKARLKMLIAEYDKGKWKHIGKVMGKSDIGCQKVAKEMGWSK